MDFGIFPPEVNSGRMYSGPGAGPVLAAAAAWSALAAELEMVAGSYQSVVTELATGWAGPSATAMATAAMPYVTWVHGAAALAEQSAAQAHAAAAAFETAFALTVPPPVIAANRSLLATLIATNFFGQNLLAIAATEAAYAEMWAQDATAMYGYAGAAAGASVLTPFSPPPETTNPAGQADQTAAVGRAAGSAAANQTQQLLAKLSSTTHGLASPAADATSSGALGGAAGPGAEVPSASLLELGLIPIHLGVDLFGAVVIDGLGVFAIDAPGAVGSMILSDMLAEAGIAFPWIGGSPGPFIGSPMASAITASMGQAVPVSGLSVPAAWTTIASEAGPIASPGPAAAAAAGARAVAPLPAAAAPNSLNQMAMAGTAGLGATAGLGDDRRGAGATQGRRTRSPRAQGSSQLQIAAELRELIDLHDAGILSEEEFGKEKERLFGE